MAFLTLSTVDIQAVLKRTWLMIGTKRADSSSLPFYSIVDRLLSKNDDVFNLFLAEGRGSPCWLYFGSEQYLISVDISDSTNFLLIEQQLLDCFVIALSYFWEIINSKSLFIVDFWSKFTQTNMLHFLSFIDQVHGPEFSDIIIHQTIAILEQKLNMVMFLGHIFLVIHYVLSLHP